MQDAGDSWQRAGGGGGGGGVLDGVGATRWRTHEQRTAAPNDALPEGHAALLAAADAAGQLAAHQRVRTHLLGKISGMMQCAGVLPLGTALAFPVVFPIPNSGKVNYAMAVQTSV